MVALLTVAIILVAAAIAVWMYSLFTSPERASVKVAMKQTKVSSNHLDMYLFIRELITADMRGFNTILDKPQLEAAKQLVAEYREETTQ